MNDHRFEVRPIASRRLRAALLLVALLAALGITQTALSAAETVVAWLAWLVILVDGWRRTRMPPCPLQFTVRPLACMTMDNLGESRPLVCRRVSVYPWIVVLDFSREGGALNGWPASTLVLLRDSVSSDESWRHLLVWSGLMRRQLANQ